MKWEKVKLSDCCDLISDGDHQPPPKTEKGIPFVTIANIDSSNHFNFSDTMFVPQEYYDSFDSKRKARTGDILYSVVGSFGIPVLIKEDRPFAFQRHIAILRPNGKILPAFLYYTMLTKDFYAMADAAAIGAAQRTITLTALRNMEIAVPQIDVQKRIADILSAYDELIENNQKQIKLLEEAAQRLYKEWFVDLRFPGYENTPIVDGVPEGWERLPIGKLIEKIPRTTQIMASEYGKEGLIPIIDQSRDFIAGYTDNQNSIINLGKPVIVFGDHTRILKFIQFPFAKGADGTQLIVTNTERMPQTLFYCSLVRVDLSNYHYARHFKYLKAEEILVPRQKIADKFDSFVSSIFSEIQSLRNIIVAASKARDRLLPKLMSGEIEV